MIAVAEIAKMIDHSILHPVMTDQDLAEQCDIAKKYAVATVCVKPYHVKQAAKLLVNSGVGVCAVAGFPHGNSTIEIKVAETLQVISDGATEVDMVINIGKVLQEDWHYIKEEINRVNLACINNGAILKVIFETDFIRDEHLKINLCKICSKHKVAYVKTSTGYGFVKGEDGKYNYTGATESDIILMKKYCAPEVKIKAAGGIRNLMQLLRARELGASRIGASATPVIMMEALGFKEH
ncbi:MAG: deoxyribose-phosphate aldolase [Bacteroidales bacterium]|nr:deoxyribose-phosphate aldolase [Bacteroidales bacterium]